MLPTKSTMFFPSVHDMCLGAHEPCLGLPTAYGRSRAGSAGTRPKPPQNTSSDPQPKDDAHQAGRPAPMACRKDEQRWGATHREGRIHPPDGSARRGLQHAYGGRPNGLWEQSLMPPDGLFRPWRSRALVTSGLAPPSLPAPTPARPLFANISPGAPVV